MAESCELSIDCYEVNQTFVVEILHITNPHCFYVRPLDLKENLKILEEHYAVHPTELKLDLIVVYNSETTKRKVRGQIINVYKDDDKTVDICAIDYGHIDKGVKLKDIFLPKIPTDVPPLATQCKLADCIPEDSVFTDKESNTMREFIGEGPCTIVVKEIDDTRIVVDLYNSGSQNVANLLALRQLTNLSENNLSLSNIKTKDIVEFTKKCVKVNEKILVRLLATKTDYRYTYYVVDVYEYSAYINGRQEFTDYCSTEHVLKDVDFRVGKSVGHKPNFSRFYERAIIKEILEDGSRALLYLIDFGKLVRCDRKAMRDVKLKKFFTLPGIAFQCTFVEGKDHRSLYEQLIPGTETWISVKEIGNPNIVEIVRAQP